MRRVAVVSVAFLLALLLAPSGSSAERLRWGPCAEGTPRGFECARLHVALDAQRPGRGTWPIALIRKRAEGGRARLGSLVVNFGGPGGSGLAALPDFVEGLPRSVRRRFDLVSFDPRGVGASRPIDCGADFDRIFGADAATAEGAAEIIAGYGELGAACARRVGARTLSRLGTQDVVADLDRIRAALGDRRLSYVGLSYGTRIGALYADRFPRRVRALVLDGAMDPVSDFRTLGVDQAQAWDDVLARVFAECAASRSCPLGSDPAARFDELLDRVRARPLPAGADPTGRRLTAGWLHQATVAMTAFADTHGFLMRALADALATGDGSELLAAADAGVGRDTRTGAYLNVNEVFAAVNCLDFPARPGPGAIAADAALARILAPRLGVAAVYTDEPLCVGWPVAPRPVQPATARHAPPLLVVGTISDPSTPYRWSQRLAGALRTARLLTFDGIGHTVVGRLGGNGSSCTDRWVARYLIERKLPPPGTVCTAPVAPST